MDRQTPLLAPCKKSMPLPVLKKVCTSIMTAPTHRLPTHEHLCLFFSFRCINISVSYQLHTYTFYNKYVILYNVSHCCMNCILFMLCRHQHMLYLIPLNKTTFLELFSYFDILKTQHIVFFDTNYILTCYLRFDVFLHFELKQLHIYVLPKSVPLSAC